MPEDQYTHGHHASVVNSHATRSIADSAQYVEPLLTAGSSLLDVGCGPGTITAELAERVSPGRVVGVDISPEVIADAQARFPDSAATFAAMDCYDLDFDDDSFDIAHAHQVLQHVSDPVQILREMRRVVRPGGIVAVRDADYAAFHWAPASSELDEWQSLYREVAQRNDAEPDAGRHLLRWAAEAGFTDVTATHSTWLYADASRCGWLGSTWSQRVLSSSLAEQAIAAGLARREDLERLSQGWLDWSTQPHAWFVIPHGELICRV